MKWNLSGTVDLAERNIIVDDSHPIVTAQFSDQKRLTNLDLYSNWCSHGWFSNLPPGTREILRESIAEGGRPTLVEYRLGRGTVIASTLTWEHNWSYHYGSTQYGTFARKVLDDVFLYAFSKGVEQTSDVRMSLRIEDAVSGSSVIKSQNSYIDVIVNLSNHSNINTYDVQIALDTDQGDFYDNYQIYIRSSQSDQNMQSGQLMHLLPGEAKEEIHRYHIKPDALASDQDNRVISLKTNIRVGGHSIEKREISFEIRRTVGAIVVTNRRLLYQRWGQDNSGLANVSQLLNRLFETASGIGVVFYADLYDDDIANWDNFNTGQLYADESSANRVAQKVDGLIEGWYVGLTKVHRLGPIVIGKDAPKYLMIVGGDETVPFYRYKDPTDDEATYSAGSAPEIEATRHNYVLTDDVYADMSGNDWERGELEVGVGRIVGSSATAMGDLLTRIVVPDADTAVLASSAGWDLGSYSVNWGLEHNVPLLFRIGGFNVRNDDEEPRTIDHDDWSEAALREAANSEKVAFFFIGDHANHTSIGAPHEKDNFTVADVGPESQRQFTGFGEDHPLVFLSGCHTGLPVTGDSRALVQGLLENGALAYVGNTGYSYGYTLWRIGAYSEVLAGYYVNALVTGFGSETRTIGDAMRIAKKEMPSGLFLSARDKKTYVETVLFGVPWRTLRRPANQLQAETFAGTGVLAPDYVSVTTPHWTGVNTYSLTVSVDIPDYTVSQIDGYDVITVANGALDFSQGQPVVPAVNAYRLDLPPGASFVSARVVSSERTTIGLFNLPAADNRPVVLGGSQFVPTTIVDQLYPLHIISAEVRNNGVYLQVVPIQHNTATKQTYHLQNIDIEIIYESTLPVGILDFLPSGRSLVPGMAVGGQTVVGNVSDVSRGVTVRLLVRDPAGREVADSGSTLAHVAPGGVASVRSQWQPDLPDGRYSLDVELVQDGQVMGREREEIEIRSGRLKNVEIVHDLHTDRPDRFLVTYANDSSRLITFYGNVYIYDDQGREVTKLPQKTTDVTAHTEATTEFVWDATGLADGRYMLFAVATAGDLTFGPVSQPFAIGAPRQVFASFLPMIDRGRSTPVSVWHRAPAVEDHTVYQFASTDAACTAVLAGTDRGAVRSSDGGRTWTPAFASASSATTFSAAFDELANASAGLTPAIVACPSDPAIVYLTTWGGGVYRSTDAGTTWQPRSGGGSSPYLYDLDVVPHSCNTVYAASAEAGVFKTSDGGGNWQAANTGLQDRNTRSLALAPGNANRLWVGTTSGVFRSTNGGASWQGGAGLPADRVWALAVAPNNANLVYAGLENNGVYRSVDGGATWQPRHNGLGAVKVRALAIDPLNPSVIYAGRDDGGGVYRSLDGGATWTAFNAGLTSRNVKSLWLDGGSCRNLLAGTTNGAWYFGP